MEPDNVAEQALEKCAAMTWNNMTMADRQWAEADPSCMTIRKHVALISRGVRSRSVGQPVREGWPQRNEGTLWAKETNFTKAPPSPVSVGSLTFRPRTQPSAALDLSNVSPAGGLHQRGDVREVLATKP